MGLKIRPDLCVGCGLCESKFPEGIKVLGDGVAYFLNESKIDMSRKRELIRDCRTSAILEVEAKTEIMKLDK